MNNREAFKQAQRELGNDDEEKLEAAARFCDVMMPGFGNKEMPVGEERTYIEKLKILIQRMTKLSDAQLREIVSKKIGAN